MYREENKETKNRIRNIGLGIGALTATAYVLKNGDGLRNISKFLSDSSKTLSKIVDDISLSDSLDANSIKRIARTHFLDEDSTWKTLRKSDDIELDYSRGLLSGVLQYRRLEYSTTYLQNEMYNAEEKGFMIKDVSERIKKQSSDFYKELTKLVDDSIENKQTFFTEVEGRIKADKESFFEYMKGSILEDKKEEVFDAMETAINEAQKYKYEFEEKYTNTKDTIVNQFKEELKRKYSNKEDFFKGTLDRAATLDDLLNAVEDGKTKISNLNFAELGENMDMLDVLKELKRQDSDFGKLVLDNATLRVNADGELYSTKGIRDLTYKMKEEVADTIPGKLFFARSFVDLDKAPDFVYLPKGSYDPIIAKLTGSKSGVLTKDTFRMGDRFFQLDKDTLTHISEADDLFLMSGKHGAFNVLNNRMQGNIPYKRTDNKFLKFFDLGRTGATKLDEIKGMFTKYKLDSDWERSSVNRLFQKERYEKIDEAAIRQFNSDVRNVNRLYNARTFAPDKKTLYELKNRLGGENSFLSVLDKENYAEELLKQNFKPLNKDLAVLLGKYKTDINSIKNMAQIGDLGDKAGKNILRYNDLLKREIAKEALMQDVVSKSWNQRNDLEGYAMTYSKLKTLNISGKERKNLENLFDWTIFQKETKSSSSARHSILSLSEKASDMKSFKEIVFGESHNAQLQSVLDHFRMNVTEFVANATSFKDSVIENDNVTKAFRSNDWVTMRKSISPLDIIKDINDTTKQKKFLKQFVAGRDNTNDVTLTTLLSYHMLNRLSTPLESIGLGFSADNTKSIGNMAFAFGAKRILPLIGLAYTASYLNFESENLFGTSFSQSLRNAQANFVLGTKTISGAIGLDDKQKRSRMYNPIANYWLGEYKDKEEYLDYLENGYDPVRKGRWWNFGSASELRGGKISYWEPNKLRQSYSHYKDVSLYGSVDEKWKHSLFPTLRHPLSPLRYLTDPYWLEKKHYYDRPYPVSGKMFDEGTPWGVILNPTIGNIIKPQIRMHKDEMKNSLIDVKSIIARRNKQIKDSSNEKRLIRISDSGFSNVEFDPYSMPSLNEAILSLSIKDGQIVNNGFEGQDYAESLPSIRDVSVNRSSVLTSAIFKTKNMLATSVDSTSLGWSETFIDSLASVMATASPNTGVALSIIASVNNKLKNPERKGIIKEQASLYQNPYIEYSEKIQNDFLSGINLNQQSEILSDAIYSAKELSGMYGFLFDTIFPSAHGYRLEQAGNMSSFTRAFWDENIGGVGGDFMEIARRFFPHEDHNITDINPLRNTMPLWLPERFQTGDPYTKVTKGEARLPGAGYESLNKLHPDKYGRYGAFDRYKILADVAPNSDEYKTWKKVANRTITDSKLKKEMTQIEKRVKAQSKNHDFYDYHFLGKDLMTKDIIVESVSKTGQIKAIGSQESYQLAGIKVQQNKETKESYINEYIRPGMRLQIQYENNVYTQRNKDGAIAVIAKNNGDNINKMMWEQGKAIESDDKDTLADYLFAASSFNMVFGKIEEAIAHAPIPYIHNKFLRINTPLESYKEEQVYGSNYSTWEHPFKGFIKPTFQKQWSHGFMYQALGATTWYLSNKARESGATGLKKTLAHSAFAFTNPAAMAGGILGALPRMSWGSEASIWNAKNGANIGAAVGLIGYGITRLNNPLESAVNFGLAGVMVSKQLKLDSGKGALIGAGIGLGLSALKNPDFNWKRMTGEYIPEDTKKKWEIEEYYDRLKYIKYTKLYHEAAKLAKRKDKIDIEKIINSFEYNQKKNEKTIIKLQKIRDNTLNKIIDSETKTKYEILINSQISALSTKEQYVQSSKYVKAALAYKQAADTTIYGLTAKSSETDILRSLSSYDKEYFSEFAKIKDPKERAKVLKYMSPYKAKALKLLWHEEPNKVESNYSYFEHHKLPNLFWSGWQANIDLENVKMKTIENEGMLLSQFGIYESEVNQQDYEQAPEINNIHQSSSSLGVKKDLFCALNGIGLSNVDISVESTPDSGIQYLVNLERISEYNLKQKLSKVFGNI